MCQLDNSVICLLLFFPACFSSSVIVVEDAKVCFRRTFAGRRAVGNFIRKIVPCERVEECQQECADEKRFVCEGFNYRLDQSGRGQGDCELLDLPLIRLDVRRDVVVHPDYDYYEKERNTYDDCKYNKPINYIPHRDHSYVPSGDTSHLDNYPPRRGYAPHQFNRRPIQDVHYRPHFGDRDGVDRYQRPLDRRGDAYDHSYTHNTYESSHRSHHELHQEFDHNRHYNMVHQHTLPPPPPPRHHYEPYLPPQYNFPPENNILRRYQEERERDRHFWGMKHADTGWASYGGPYGDFGTSLRRNYDNYNTRFHHTNELYDRADNRYSHEGERYDTRQYGAQTFSHGHSSASHNWGSNESFKNVGGYHYNAPHKIGSYVPAPPLNNEIGGVEHRGPKNDCSLRSASGFRLYRNVVKKILQVNNIYECEIACFKEKSFLCASYAFSYIIGAKTAPDNCYLSDKNYKELDYFTDFEQDRNFDVYTMNNVERCSDLVNHGRDFSDCFWHVRSGQRLDRSCVKISLNVRSIVECQIACLKSNMFTCRTFSFRFGPPVIGGFPDNCVLSDLSFLELNTITDLSSDIGFETFDRGSFGHGCELNHFSMRNRPKPIDQLKRDEICYAGYELPAGLLPDAARKKIFTHNDIECKAECTKLREEGIFNCMSLSFSTTSRHDEPNCCLSNIFQRDLLEHIDYIKDSNSWLFAWDNYNPLCHQRNSYLPSDGKHSDHRGNDLVPYNPNWHDLDTWKTHSVGGWPCKRNTLCKQNPEVGFWYCELEGGSPTAWDYCCRPTHQCGYSEGYSYQWCYVGPSSTQWRKCSDKYYPYIQPLTIHINKPSGPYLPTVALSVDQVPPHKPSHQGTNVLYPPTKPNFGHREPRPWATSGSNLLELQPPYRPPFRPDRPDAPIPLPPSRPSLNEYEDQFDEQFLDPPKPGGFGQGRYWPISYLHKEQPPNANASYEHKSDNEKTTDSKFEAIQNLINIIKSDDMKNIQFQITNGSNKADEILFVQIPLPTNLSENETTNLQLNNDVKLNDPIDLAISERNVTKNINGKKVNIDANSKVRTFTRSAPLYRRGYVTRTHIPNYVQKEIN